MRTLRLSLVGTVILALLGGLGGMALAQDEDPWFGEWLEPTEEGVFGGAGHDLPNCVLDKAEREAEYEPEEAARRYATCSSPARSCSVTRA